MVIVSTTETFTFLEQLQQSKLSELGWPETLSISNAGNSFKICVLYGTNDIYFI